jgi:gag-polypeptide of LTR copia-type
LKDLGLQGNSAPRDTPALSSQILQKYSGSECHNEKWNYRAVIGKLNYLEKSTRPDLAYAVHQCARFSIGPKVEHTRAVKLIGRYLLSTADRGIICTPNDDSFHLYLDADFSGNWASDIAEHDASTARSRPGYVVKYAGCPIVWASRLQTEIALSSTESEYVALSQGLREVLLLMKLTKELAMAGFGFSQSAPRVFCKAFEDNSGASKSKEYPDGNITIAWLRLKKKYAPAMAPTLAKYQKMFYGAKLKHGSDPDGFITYLEELRLKMEEMGSQISDTQFLLHVMNNLSPEYKNQINLL